MNQIVYAQLSALAAVAVLCALIGGSGGFWSALAGGLSYLLPSAVAVLLLKIFRLYPQWAGKIFLLGEGLKVMLALVLMLIVFTIWHETLQFLPFIAGLFVVSHLVFLALLRVGNYGR
ncbi:MULTISPECIES: ATP synthase subunit I [Neisseria]|uniref:ATP synthase I chain family protein n=1 Tax=Neisseria musculi TaxID=1815583 RepID=A0A7H1M801_9NEIS|nr:MULTISPECIES: ATP synthase subunit I [Neisseria]MBF0803095.1 ATP synthase subunit I [Neisseria sp. 19428wB4_WF04]QNT57766.1 ATP synthase I chain family protein [Neisseria musculi]TFU44220.1 F0F1 ATP synthase subunit I [Neisseria sp. WF04]